MLTAVLALPLAAQLIAPVTADVDGQSQFTRPNQAAETMRFREMDRNNDGVVTQSEWRGTLQSFRTHDWNGDGILSGNEVRQGMAADGSSIDEREFDRDEQFQDLDVNRDGQVQRSEWHGSADAFTWLDRNNDGVLNRREVVGRGNSANARGQNRRSPQASSASATSRQDCVDNAARIVDDIYQQVLERPADQASSGMTQALVSGRMTVRDIVTQLAKSDEHAKRHFWQPVSTTLYRQILKREPTEQELQRMTSDLAASPRGLSTVVARTARRAASSDEDAVKILYRRLLGREADPEGLRGFTDLARREGIEIVARDLMASDEYRQRVGPSGLPADDVAAYEGAVRSLYRHVLGRDPDPAGLQDLTRIAATSGFAAVVDRMVSSAEYERTYGANVVPGRGVRYCGSTP